MDCKLHTEPIVALKYSNEGSMLATASADRRSHIISLLKNSILTTIEDSSSLGLNDCAWLNDSFIATASNDQTVKIWDIQQGKAISTFKGHNSSVYSMSINPFNKVLVTGGYDGDIILFHPTMKNPIMSFKGHSEPIVSVESSPTHHDYASGSQDGLIRIWDYRFFAACTKTINCSPTQQIPLGCISYSKYQQCFLISSLNSLHRLLYYNHTSKDQIQRRYNVAAKFCGHINKRYSIKSCLYEHYTGSKIISGSEDGKVYVWNMHDQNLVSVIDGEHGETFALSCNPDENVFQFASAGTSGFVKVWNMSSIEDNLINASHVFVDDENGDQTKMKI